MPGLTKETDRNRFTIVCCPNKSGNNGAAY